MRTLACSLFLVAATTAFAAEPAKPDERIVELPPLVVSESTRAPRWLYLRLPEDEILSGCSPAVTRDFARACWRLSETLQFLVDRSLLPPSATPRIHVLVNEDQVRNLSHEVIAGLIHSEETRTPFVALEAVAAENFLPGASLIASTGLDPFERPSYGAAPAGPAPVRFLPNLALRDGGTAAVLTVVREWSFRGERIKLSADALRAALEMHAPPLPRWFIDGLLALHESATFTEDAITLAPLRWISRVETQLVRQNPRAPHTLLPLGELFATPRADAPAEHAARRRAQLQLFLRWVFDDPTGARKAALWQFVAESGLAPADESAFHRCFGRSEEDVDSELRAYLPRAVRAPVKWKCLPAQSPALEPRAATRTEIARLKGEWERLQANYVKARLPHALPHYVAQARATLDQGYEGAGTDPRLLAAMGLFRRDTGDDENAHELLVAATNAGVADARAHYELARFRYDHARRALATPGSALSSTQLAEILAPLFAARALPPPRPEVYELIAAAWSASAETPRREHLAVLDEGVRLFPQRVRLIYQTAALYTKHGFTRDAAPLIELGLKITAESEARRRFEELKNKLPPRG